MESKKIKKQIYIRKKKHAHRYRKHPSRNQWGEERLEGQERSMRLRGTNYYV